MAERRLLIALAVVALAFVWGTQYLVIRVVRDSCTPEQAVLLRFALVAVVAQVLVLALGVRAPRGIAAARVGLGLLQALSMLLLYRAQRDVASAWASIIMATSPLFVVVFARLALKETIAARTVIALTVGFAGVVIIIGPLGSGASAALLLLLVVAAAANAGAKVVAKSAAATISPVILLRDLGVVVALVSLPFAVASGVEVEAFDGRALLGHVYLGLIASAGATGVYFWLLSHMPVTRLAYLPFASGMIGVAAGILVGEELGVAKLAGAAVVLVGLALLLRGKNSVTATTPAPPS